MTRSFRQVTGSILSVKLNTVKIRSYLVCFEGDPRQIMRCVP